MCLKCQQAELYSNLCLKKKKVIKNPLDARCRNSSIMVIVRGYSLLHLTCINPQRYYVRENSLRTCYLKWEKYVVTYILITIASSASEIKPHGWCKALLKKN